MLLMMSNLLFSQATNTSLTKCFSQDQVSEIYKGVKQAEYLKIRLEKTESVLKTGESIINEQKGLLDKKDEIIALKNDLIETNKLNCEKQKEILGIEINQLTQESKVKIEFAKKEGRKKFWKGVKTGGIVGGVVTAAAVFFLIK